MSKLFSFFQNSLFQRKNNIVIFDDFLPSSLSPWRSYEFHEIAKNFQKVKIICDGTTFQNYNQGKSFKENFKLLIEQYPFFKNVISKSKKDSNVKANLAYMLFYNNIKKHFAYIEENKIPFAFTLYPGGGFVFNDNTINENLKKICNSNLFKGVIVNQYVTKEYLIENAITVEDKITLISGVSLNLNGDFKSVEKDNSVIKIVFFANKYTVGGKDKGFDFFQEIVFQLFENKQNILPIVIGNFSDDDLEIKELRNKIIFKGVLNEVAYQKELETTHVLISPNKPNILAPGAFDGFPLSTAVAASLANNVLFLTDHFNESEKIGFMDTIDYFKLTNSLEDNVILIKKVISNMSLMKEISQNGKNKILNLYNFNNQIQPRIEFLKKCLE
jgi:hypothetical protein